MPSVPPKTLPGHELWAAMLATAGEVVLTSTASPQADGYREMVLDGFAATSAPTTRA